MIKLQLSAFSDESSKVFDEQIAALKRNGITYMEMRNVDGKNVSALTIPQAKEYANRLRGEGLAVWAVGSPIGKVKISENMQTYYDKVRHTCEIANTLGCDKIRMFSFSEAYQEREKVIEYLSQMVEIGRKYGVGMYHENEKGMYGDTVARTEDILNSVNNLKSVYDPANFLQVGESAQKSLDALHARADYFHIKDCIQATGELVPAGYGDGKIEELVRRIDKDTTLSVEPHLCIFDGYADIDETPMKNKFVYQSNMAAFDAAVKGSAAYEMIKGQLSHYINHPAFYGLVVKDEPSAWMFDESIPSGAEDRKSGTFGFTYKTLKRVALEEYGKDIYIHANLLPAATYSTFYKTHQAGQAFPELTIKRYGEITGMDVSGYADGGSTDFVADMGSAFYDDLENYIEYIGASSPGNNAQAERDMWMAIMRERFGKYCELFLQATGSPYLMADLYPVYGKTLKDRYLMELQTMAEVAATYGVDLHIVTQTMTELAGDNINAERLLSTQDVKWLNNTLLSYGVKNIVYFTYHIRGSAETFYRDTSFIDENGEKTEIWYAMQEIMAQNKAFESTYQAFDIIASKTYYNPLAVHDGLYGKYANDINYRDGELYADDSVTFIALQDLSIQGELSMVSEFTDGKGNYMYALMNVTDSKYATDVGAYEQAWLQFGEEYTHVIVWRDGVQTLIALDENNALEIENAAGEAVFIIPYRYVDKSGFYYDNEEEDNGAYFPV